MLKTGLTWSAQALGGILLGRVALEVLHKLGSDPDLWLSGVVVAAPTYLQQEIALWILAFVIGALLFFADYWARGIYRLLTNPGAEDAGPAREPSRQAAGRGRDGGRLSIVVLPFANLSGDPEEDYFADGLSEDLTTDLSQHIPGSLVIARNTAYAYKGKTVDVKKVAQELGVSYVLEGSVQRGGNKVRVNAQLIDAERGQHLWAERFDGERGNLLELQNEITGRIAGSLKLDLISYEGRRAEHAKGRKSGAADWVWRARAILVRHQTKESLREARALFERALALDATLTDAWAGIGKVLALEALSFPDASRKETLQRADDAVARTLALGANDAEVRHTRGLVRMGQRRFTEAAGEFEAAVAVDRNLSAAWGSLGAVQILLGRPQEALPMLEHAMRISPRDPSLDTWQCLTGAAHFYLGNDDQALQWLLRARGTNPNLPLTHIFLAAVYGVRGDQGEARACANEARRLDPLFTADWFQGNPYSREPEFLRLNERLLEGLRKASIVPG